MPVRRRRGKGGEEDDFEINEEELKEMEMEQEAGGGGGGGGGDDTLDDLDEAEEDAAVHDEETKKIRAFLKPFEDALHKIKEERLKELAAIGVEFSKKHAEKYYAQRTEILKHLPEPEGDAEGFWTSIFSNDLLVSEYLEEDDKEAFNALINITMAAMEDKRGYVTRFHFRPNKVFSNTVLERRDWIEKNMPHATGTEIKWGPSRKRKGPVRYDQSLFAFFYPPKVATTPQEMTSRHKSSVHRDWLVSEHLRVNIIPHPYSVYAKNAKPEGDVMAQLRQLEEEFQKPQAAHADAIHQARTKTQALIAQVNADRRAAIAKDNAPPKLKIMWITALLNHPTLSAIPNAKDWMALEFLQHCRVEMKGGEISHPSDLNPLVSFSRAQNWRLVCEFGENDFFTDKELWIDLILKDCSVVDIRTSGVNWKKDHRLTVHGGSLQLPADKKKYKYSFFLLFEETEKKKKKSPTGLMTILEKEGICEQLRHEVIPNVTELALVNLDAIEDVPVHHSSDEDLDDHDDDDDDDSDGEEGGGGAAAAGGAGGKDPAFAKRKAAIAKTRKSSKAASPSGMGHQFCVYLIAFLLVGSQILGFLSFMGYI